MRDLTEHDVVSRIMRKENYLIGMLNKGVLALHVGTPCLGLRKKFMLTKTLEWNLHWCLLDCMFGEDFRLKPAFLQDAQALQRRFRFGLHIGSGEIGAGKRWGGALRALTIIGSSIVCITIWQAPLLSVSSAQAVH